MGTALTDAEKKHLAYAIHKFRMEQGEDPAVSDADMKLIVAAIERDLSKGQEGNAPPNLNDPQIARIEAEVRADMIQLYMKDHAGIDAVEYLRHEAKRNPESASVATPPANPLGVADPEGKVEQQIKDLVAKDPQIAGQIIEAAQAAKALQSARANPAAGVDIEELGDKERDAMDKLQGQFKEAGNVKVTPYLEASGEKPRTPDAVSLEELCKLVPSSAGRCDPEQGQSQGR